MSSGTQTNESKPRLRLNLPYSKVNFIVVWLGGVLVELCGGWFSYTVSYFLFLGSINHESLYSRFRKRASVIFGPSLPEEIDNAKFLTFGSGWSPISKAKQDSNCIVYLCPEDCLTRHAASNTERILFQNRQTCDPERSLCFGNSGNYKLPGAKQGLRFRRSYFCGLSL